MGGEREKWRPKWKIAYILRAVSVGKFFEENMFLGAPRVSEVFWVMKEHYVLDRDSGLLSVSL